MKLHEEFKEYETLWGDLDPVDQILNSTDDFPLYYDYDEEWYEDHFSPVTGHYTTGGTHHYTDVCYEVTAGEMFEAMQDILPKYAAKKESNPLVKKYLDLEQKLNATSTPEDEEKVYATIDLFMAQNLDELSYVFDDEVHDYFEDSATGR